MDKTMTATLEDLHLQPVFDQELQSVWRWLEKEELISQGCTMDVKPGELNERQCYDGATVAIAQATQRNPVKRKTKKSLKAIKEKFKHTTPEGVDQESVWEAIKDTDAAVRTLKWQRLPADAMAFYRPFHYPPFDQWGIYLLVGPLLDYHSKLQLISANLKLFSPEILMHLVLFEIFNHEFFHHLAESTATNLEILAAAQGEPQRVYLDYQQRLNGFGHPHAPLEEALANAYAYNALSFICRIKAGYKTASVRAYQEAIKRHWHLEPNGYCHAAYYIDGQYVPGGAHLLAQILGKPEAVKHVPLSSLAKHVMPNGFTALVKKPDIPTYLVGSNDAIESFRKLVPSPNEAYTQLFWPYNTNQFDEYVQKKKQEEKLRRKLAKQAMNNPQQQEMDL